MSNRNKQTTTEKANISGIKEFEIIDKLEEYQQLEEAIKSHFRCDSRFWNALIDYIYNADINNCAVCDKQHEVRIYRGVGPAITLRRVYAKPPGAHPHSDTTVRFCFDVVYYDEEEDEEKQTSEMIDVPISIVVNFSHAEFNTWIAGRKTDFLLSQTKNVSENIEYLLKKLPVAIRKKTLRQMLKGEL